MEKKGNQSYQNPSDPTDLSRMQQDLAKKSHDHRDSPSQESNRDPTDKMLKRTLTQGKVLRVCIVGAGITGLRAADVLLQHGVQVTILEARNRIGGRVAQSDHPGYPVDLGPNWIHGSNDVNPIMQLARQTNTTISSISEKEAVFDEDGSVLPSHEIEEITDAFWSIISDAFKHSNENCDSIPSGKSLMDFVEEQAAAKYADESYEVAERKKRLLSREAEMWGGFVGSPVTKQSLKFFWLEECIDGENLFVAGTYTKIIEKLAKPALEKAEVKLEHKVTAIKSEGESVKVTVAGGYEDTFDEVIVTTPLGWLKRNKSVFDPPLPPRLEQAIDAMGYGTLEKIYITFPTAFWDEQPDPNTTASVNPPKNTPNTTATTHPLHNPIMDSKTMTESLHAGFTHWYAPPNGWAMQALNYAALPEPHAHPTLLFYLFGECSQYLNSLTSHNNPSNPALLTFLNPYISLLPNYNPSCIPTSILATSWSTDEFAGYGSYTNFQVGLENGDKDVEVMRKGWPEGRVWLAGEHTAPFVALGTVTGAVWAGEEVARGVLGVYGLG